jgi:hypothetical protein
MSAIDSISFEKATSPNKKMLVKPCAMIVRNALCRIGSFGFPATPWSEKEMKSLRNYQNTVTVTITNS